MKPNEDQWFKEALSGFEQEVTLSETQKEKMFTYVMNKSSRGLPAWQERLVNLITVYPWRFAFGVSAIQAVLGTLIWGTKYTNLLLGFMIGG
jgi:hypothetical protein